MRKLIQVCQQFLGVGGDADKPLGDFTALHERPGTPAAPVNNLLVGQYRLVHRVPVDGCHFLVHQPLFIEAGEEPLLPAVIVGLAGGQLARPVEPETQALQLAFHVGDVLVGPGSRGGIVLHCGVLCRQAEGVPPHRVQHILAQHALVAGDDIGDGVVAHMAHVQLAAGVGEHREAVEFLPSCILLHGKALLLLPVLLGGLFKNLRLVMRVHVLVYSTGLGTERVAACRGATVLAVQKKRVILSVFRACGEARTQANCRSGSLARSIAPSPTISARLVSSSSR